MSWFKRKREFAEEADALAEDIESEFDTIAEALNGLVQMGSVTASKDTSLSGAFEAEVEIPGTEKTLTLERSSLVLVSTTFDFDLSSGTYGSTSPNAKGFVQGFLKVDGAKQPRYAELAIKRESRVQVTVPANNLVALSAGNHTLELAAEPLHEPNASNYNATVWHAATGYSYVVIPNPEP